MPPPMPDDLAARRTALLEQLTYLIDEIEVLKGIVHRVPEVVQTARPPGEAFSMRETYGLLAALDTEVHRPRLRRLSAEDEPALDPADPAALAAAADWNERPIADLLDDVQAARRTLVEALEALPPEAWARTATLGGARLDVYALALGIARQDADLLRPVGYRLHAARLTDRPQDLPK